MVILSWEQLKGKMGMWFIALLPVRQTTGRMERGTVNNNFGVRTYGKMVN